MQIHAVATNPPVDIKAAMASAHYRGVEHVIRAAGLDERLANGGPIPLAELDAALAKKAVGTTSRIAIKSALGRVGLLKD
jgi:hypothetical protein